jgi:hypothetical protein
MSRVRCLAYPTCPRRFTTKGGMMAHLESGACRSKITRKRIDDLIRQHDTNNVILKVGAGGGTPPYFSITPSPAPSGSITSELSESDSDDEGTIIFSATTSATLPHEDPMIFSPVSSATMSRRDETSFSPVSSATLSQHEETIIFSPSSSATISRQESFMDTALIPTPSYALSAESTPGPPGFDLSSGRVCYICGKGFKAIKGLEQHLNSITHEPRIYHCPTFLFAGATTKPQKDFISISGLIMHLESGACEGGSEGLDRALEFVEEKLNEEGVGHLLRG